MTVGGYPNPNMIPQNQQPIYTPQPGYPQQSGYIQQLQQPIQYQQPQQPLQYQQTQYMQYQQPQQPQVDQVRLEKLKTAQVPGISFKNLIALMGFQPVSGTTNPGAYNMQLNSFQAQMSELQYEMAPQQSMVPCQSSNPMGNFQIIHLHQLKEMKLNSKSVRLVVILYRMKWVLVVRSAIFICA